MNTATLPTPAAAVFSPEEAGTVIDVGRMLRYRLARLQKAIVDEVCCGLLLLGVHNKRYATGMLRSAIFNAHKPSSAASRSGKRPQHRLRLDSSRRSPRVSGDHR